MIIIIIKFLQCCDIDMRGEEEIPVCGYQPHYKGWLKSTELISLNIQEKGFKQYN